MLRRAARSHPNSVAVDDGRVSWTLQQLLARGERLANALDSLGVPPGAAVGILSHNRTAYVEADVAIALARRVRVALNARLHLEDFRYVAADAGLRVLFHSAEFSEQAAALREEFGIVTISFDPPLPDEISFEQLVEDGSGEVRVREMDPELPAWVSYTSGTTGRPKGVQLSHRAVREVAFNLLLELGPVVPGEQIVLTQPVSHGAGYFTLPYLLSGAGVHVQPKFDPEEVWSLSTRERVRTLKLVPAMLEPVLAAEKGSWGYETIVYGASSIPAPVLDRAVERFGPTLVQDYGQSEAPMTITCLHKDDHLDPKARLSAGRPWRTVAVEVRDEDGGAVGVGETGEVFVQGSHMMTCYLNKPAETAEVLRDGWLRTKDLAVVDERGFIHLRGRQDEMIISGGFNIAPREVEEVLCTHSAVDEVVVLGMPDERWGDVVTAVVRPRAGAALTEEEVLRFARPRLGMRAPKQVAVWSEIPRNSYGKVDRQGIKSLLRQEVRCDR
ncbi:AMP-binding protein [Streptomyces albidus (ex Kaewkla and Franco 2022)]|uniref:AMP-binding protein n=1 Tax=Streptomyces albidus (ex Kaewkla and Franco 2022) TaxID=722709 RepID=UPI001F44A3C7|nr:AMP-binding protein [Streptomyces albidus (ex Kaewkla and Franco 2022)]